MIKGNYVWVVEDRIAHYLSDMLNSQELLPKSNLPEDFIEL